MKKTLTLLVAVACMTVALTSCKPGYTYEAMAKTPSGGAVQRNTCRIHWKLNVHEYSDHGRAAFKFNYVEMLHDRIDKIGKLTKVHWVFDGYTTDTWESTKGQDYAMNKGVLIELRGPTTWSQPKPNKGPVYTGGIMFFDVEELSYHWRYPNAIADITDHELGHQYGLGDLYDNVGAATDRTQKMGDTRRPWGAGDMAGFKRMTKDSLDTCWRETHPR